MLLKLLEKRRARKIFVLGMEYFHNNDFEKALTLFNKAIVNYRTAEVYTSIGLCKFYLKDGDWGVSHLSKAISMEPKISEYYYNRGFVYSELKKFELAIQDYKKSIEIDPLWFAPYYACAYDLFELKRYLESTKYLFQPLNRSDGIIQ